MDHAIQLACENLRRPFGSVIVDRKAGEIISEGRNKNYANPILHSDIAAINGLAAKHEELNWADFDLYTTAEPNAMCMAAILWAGISRVFYGTNLPRLTELGFRQIEIPAAEVIDRAMNLDCQLIAGIRKKECDDLFTAAAKLESL